MIERNFKTLSSIGAISCNTFKTGNTAQHKQNFSRHYFNAEGLEIAYVIFDMERFTGLTVLDTPRKWSETLLNDKDYSELTPITKSFY